LPPTPGIWGCWEDLINSTAFNRLLKIEKTMGIERRLIMNSKCKLLVLAVLLAVGMVGVRAADSGAPARSAEEIAKITEAWNQKTHGRPVVINWTYMTVRCNQDKRASGEYMYWGVSLTQPTPTGCGRGVQTGRITRYLWAVVE
jgi:hypothetical protein